MIMPIFRNKNQLTLYLKSSKSCWKTLQAPQIVINKFQMNTIYTDAALEKNYFHVFVLKT